MNKQLKFKLAKMLPKKIMVTYLSKSLNIYSINWIRPNGQQGMPVDDNQMLEVCNLIEKSLSDAEYIQFRDYLITKVLNSKKSNLECGRNTLSASWEQRGEAIVSIKNTK